MPVSITWFIAVALAACAVDSAKKRSSHKLEDKLDLFNAELMKDSGDSEVFRFCNPVLLSELKGFATSSSEKVPAAILFPQEVAIVCPKPQQVKLLMKAMNKLRRQCRRMSRRLRRKSSASVPPAVLSIFNKSASVKCRPRKTVVDLDVPVHAIVFPKCTMVKRCSGCGCADGETCTPTKTVVSKRKIIIMDREADVTTSKIAVKKVPVEEHVECDCKCKVQAGDCADGQVYRKHECRCVCANEQEMSLCESPHHWDHSKCRCRCSNHLGCSTGLHVDRASCRCVPGTGNVSHE